MFEGLIASKLANKMFEKEVFISGWFFVLFYWNMANNIHIFIMAYV